MKNRLWRPVVLALIVTNVSCSGKGPGAPENAADTPASQSASVRSVGSDPIAWIDEWRKDAFAGQDPRKIWERYSQAVQAELTKPGADPSDIKARADALGRDPQKIFEFMRDQISLEPYAGVLRGARGTLVAGAGNALDRALLAQEFLRAEDIESRLVMGKLSEAQADRLLARFLDGSAIPKVLADLVATPDDAELNAEAADLSAKVDLPERSVMKLLQHARAQEQEFWAKTDSQRATQFDFLSGQLQRGGVKTAIDRAALSVKLKERLREHYWLQVREANGKWTEFDPTFSDAKPGVAYGSGPVPLPEIPKDKFHQLEFSLVYRTVTNGAPTEQVLIAGTFASANALFEPLEFRIQPVDLGVQPSALATMDPKQKIAVLRKVKRFQGILRAGSNATGSRAFDLDGNIYDAAGPSLGASGGTFFGDALGGGEEAPPQFVELEVVMRLSGPDRQPMSQTRTLVRAEDVMAPTFAPPLLEWDMLLQPQWVSAEFVGVRALNQIIATGKALMNAPSAGQAPAIVEPPPSVALPLLQMALLRQSAAAGILAKQDGIRAVVDEPMLTISAFRVTELRDQEEQIVAERQIDIVENGVRYLAKSDASQTAAFDAALRQGVADCTIEDRFLQEVFPQMLTQSGTTIIEQAQVQKRPALLANAQDIDKLRSAGMAEADIEWIHDNESPAARLLVATTANGSDAWWSIRADGNAILRSTGGQGAALVEYNLATAKVAFGTMCIVTNFQQHMKLVRAAQTSKDFEEADAELRRGYWKCAVLSSLAGVSFIGGVYVHGWHTVSFGLMFFEAALAGDELHELAH
jgi:hypothetical protein